jgi:imidazolonepropionase-like amidohydrolase
MVAFQGILNDVRHYAANRASYERGEGKELRLSAADLDALIPVVRGQIPLVVNVHRASDIARVIDMAQSNGLKIIINGGGEAWLMASRLAEAKIPVILDTTQNLPEDFDRVATRLDSAAILSKAGVKIIITGEGNANHRVRENRLRAGMAVANGMAYDEGVKSLTLYPAQAFGLKGLGSIEAGNLADLVIWSDDPLEMLSQPEIVFINGKRQALTSRASQLADRYKHGTASHSVAYPKP